MAVKTVTLVNCNEKDATALKRLVGAFCVCSFIVVWLSSIFSPFFFVVAILKENYVVAATITIITIASYVPWNKGPISGFLKHLYSYYHPFYYKSFSIEFEGDSLPSPDKDPQTFYAVHPHGAFCMGWGALYCNPLMEHVRFCFSPALFASPFFRLFSRCIGNPGSASRSSMVQNLKSGMNLALPPGGFEEATLTSTTQDRVFIKKRTGFIRLCLMQGCRVRPVYVFGERNLFSNIQGMWSFRLALNRYGIPTILVFGHPLFPMIPKNHAGLKVVVGAPIVLPKIPNPTKEEVSLWHKKYIAALKMLFEKHKEDAYGPEEGKVAKLEVW